MADLAPEHTEAADSWAHTLDLIAKEQAQAKAAERTGRGVRRKAAIAAENQVYLTAPIAINRCTYCCQQKLDFLDSPVKETHRKRKRKKSKSTASEESDAYVNANQSQSENSDDELLDSGLNQDLAELGVSTVRDSKTPTWLNSRDPSAHPQETGLCAMCGNTHQGTCEMTDNSKNLVHYRQMLLANQTGEPFEERVRRPDK
jgi:chromodomain-helicase-DNA-binding protein 4